MTPPRRPLVLAVCASLLVHGAAPLTAWLASLHAPPSRPPAAPPLQARLQPAAQLPETPELKLKAETSPAESSPQRPPERPPAPPPSTRQHKAASWQQAVRQQFSRQDSAGLFYPEVAIRQGIEGEVLVLLILGSDGEVAAARVEQGSGHAILDEAALRAVRRLQALPADAPRETLLPVRFRLR